ncbi:ABC transporter permease subunit [Nakamurella multipartita]|uniref:Maltose/maltodextrin transport system permease protein n=1 Tax=Nakamurella multipartita (strain ATCC 700099 / DSM 44233 / CIP 104796 / JCM 9543 / NBRC 105858 / Y-104) TaxID=479431 RepID=C8X7V9_NAKMY|nr:ABC transporter permease subunit [Nakamurella multipartita]ACV80962.1 binding-protein-dependent transport systems inner membrane component [Nakamurella multipartita DSM 44233]
MTDTAPAVQEEREAPASRSPGAGNLIIKIILVGLIDALLIYCLAQAWTAGWWPAVVFFAIVLIAVNAVYFTKGNLPLKYLIPGLVFLIVYQLFMMLFTAYLSFTNYGTGHLDSKDAAIVAIQASNVVPVEGGTEYAVVPIEQNGTVSMLVTDPATNQVRIGTNEGLTEVPAGDVQRDGDRVTGVSGYQSLNLASLSGNPDLKAQWDALSPPVNADEGTYLRAISITRAREARSGFTYDEAQDAMINTATGEVYLANNDDGAFINATTGQRLNPGWTVGVGFSNYVKLLTDQTIRESFLPILLWTFAFAILTTFLNFSLGLALALILQERRMRGKGIYRVLLIIPYGLPVILTALVWQGMLNADFGIVNQILGANIQWLNDPWLAKFSVLMVNLWMGFPYFFLVCSGALTSVPADLKEAAFVDGASSRHAFRTVVLPLLLVATAPLLVTTFAFNFNNYTLINLLTGGGPFSGSAINGGSTDLLINYTLRVAFTPANQQMGLASAIAMLIFVIVGSVSAYGFRLTRKLEEIGR